MAFAPEGVNRSGIVISDFLLFRVVTNTHTDVVVTCPTTHDIRVAWHDDQGDTYHHMLNGSSNRVIRIPCSILRALSPRACFPVMFWRGYTNEVFTRI